MTRTATASAPDVLSPPAALWAFAPVVQVSLDQEYGFTREVFRRVVFTGINSAVGDGRFRPNEQALVAISGGFHHLADDPAKRMHIVAFRAA